ncbi:MAG TPA: TetR/AcrR family transcriptional regulator [Stellaceae bacterium]|nr:TetR/AcrR family transcriptional regulator [Stellaceae bacterium]
MSALPRSGEQKQAKRERCTAEVRRRAILDAAASVFLERGYAGASVDAVIDRAGGSKASVYQMFGNKEGLLAALVTEGAEALTASVDALPIDRPLAESLTKFGDDFLQLVFHPTRLALYRLVVGESGRLPELGDVFYRTGPEGIIHRLADFFRLQAQRGAIVAPEPERLASYFIGALRGDMHFRALFNPTRAPTTKEISLHVAFVVSTFLKTATPAAV